MRKNVRKKTKNARKCAQMRTKDTWQDQKRTQIDGSLKNVKLVGLKIKLIDDYEWGW